MIFVDTDEKRYIGDIISRLSNLKYSSRVSKLFGCDVVISRLDKEPTSRKIAKAHARAGAILVEIKRGADLANSLMNDHLADQVMRMDKVAKSPANMIVLVTGLWMPDSSGNLRIATFNGKRIEYKKTRHEYRVARRMLTKMIDSGLVRVEWAVHDLEIAEWLADKERHLLEYGVRDRKVIFPRSLSRATGPTTFLRHFENVGEGTARRILHHCGSLAYSLAFLSEPGAEEGLGGIGAGTIEAARDALGLGEQVKLAVVPTYSKFCKRCLVSWGADEYSACPVCQGKGKGDE